MLLKIQSTLRKTFSHTALFNFKNSQPLIPSAEKCFTYIVGVCECYFCDLDKFNRLLAARSEIYVHAMENYAKHYAGCLQCKRPLFGQQRALSYYMLRVRLRNTSSS
jgi:hypothetical protein